MTTLIDEIEAAANTYFHGNARSDEGYDGYLLVTSSPYWQRIREALLSAEEMSNNIDDDGRLHRALKRFRAAFYGEGKE